MNGKYHHRLIMIACITSSVEDPLKCVCKPLHDHDGVDSDQLSLFP